MGAGTRKPERLQIHERPATSLGIAGARNLRALGGLPPKLSRPKSWAFSREAGYSSDFRRGVRIAEVRTPHLFCGVECSRASVPML